MLDGKPGKYTLMAVEAYNLKNGIEGNDDAAARAAAKKQVTRIFAIATIPSLAKDFVNPELPNDDNRELQALEKQLSYRSLAEFIAERYHTTEERLIAINAELSLTLIQRRRRRKT